MPRIASRLHGPAQVSNAAATKLTVAASEMVIVRHVHVQNPSGSSINFTASIGADSAPTRIFDSFAIAPTSTFDHFCYYPMNAGEVFQALASVGNTLVLTISGDRSILG